MLNVTSFDAPLGAKVSGLDLSKTLDEHTFSELYAAWLTHSVLVIPDQSLTESALVEFSKRLGQLEMPPASETRARGDGGASQPEIWTISNVKVDGVAIGGLGNLEADWHTDMSYLETPPVASILYAREIPEVGANTSFADMYAALDSMPADLRQRLSDIYVQHDSAYTSVGTLRDGATKVGDASKAVGAIHPAVLTHPETNRQALYMGRRLNASIQHMPMAQSENLLDEIWSFCTQRQFVYEHVWQVGDLVIWDNRCTIHRRDAFDSEQRRIMWRTQVKAR
ncbi:MAG: TauD/TfdA family dioxygenase [Gammaproteobacteria bacterium]|nr:TauD/TfdA family dioxygenase [Gammaproteobacteria bacterium]